MNLDDRIAPLRSRGVLGIALALSVMRPADEYVAQFPRKAKSSLRKPKNTKAAAQRKARKITRRNRK